MHKTGIKQIQVIIIEHNQIKCIYLGFAKIIKFRQTVKTKINCCNMWHLSGSVLFVEIKHTYHCIKPDFIFFLNFMRLTAMMSTCAQARLRLLCPKDCTSRCMSTTVFIIIF